MSAQSFLDGRVMLHAGDCLAVLDALPANSIEAVITDPPYHFDTIVERFARPGSAAAQFGTDGVFKRASAGFMGKGWDGGDIAFDARTWAKVMRVLKPGGMLAAFSAPKCYHKMAFAIEAAGFEMRDRVVHLYDLTLREIAFLESLSAAQLDALAAILAAGDPLGDLFWAFGSGFPKGLDIAKAIDKHLGTPGSVVPSGAPVKRMIPGADQHKDGWEKNNGRDYQPGEYVPGSDRAAAWDGWNIALKPAYEPIALARKPLTEKSVAAQVLKTGTGGINVDACRVEADDGTVRSNRAEMGYHGGNLSTEYTTGSERGRWPANLTHDGSDVVLTSFPDTESGLLATHHSRGSKTDAVYGRFADNVQNQNFGGDAGSAARFFYTSKADADDRLGSGHPTVKPIDLMRWLCRLLCPAGGTILDPFSGTGTTGEAAYREGFAAVLIEREAEYQADIARRMELVLAGPSSRRAAGAKAKAARRNEEADHGPLFGGITAEAAE